MRRGQNTLALRVDGSRAPARIYLVRFTEFEKVKTIGIPLVDGVSEVDTLHGFQLSLGRHLNAL